MKPKLLGAVCFAVLCIILTLGLWPFHSPHNEVTWLKRVNGVAFGKYGTVLSAATLNGGKSRGDRSGSVEIWVQPDRWSGSATVLGLYRPHEFLFTMRQSLTDLELESEVQGQDAMKEHFYVDEAFGPTLRRKHPVFITVAFGRLGATVYLNGVLTKVKAGFRIPEGAFRSRLLVGDAPGQPDSFRGQIRGLAIYDVELDGAQALRHYQTWTDSGRPYISQDERNIALYLFTEHAGNVIHNQGAAGDLSIPERYAVVDKVFLEPLWNEFEFSRSYWAGNLKNIVGFLPVGFCFYACLMAIRIRRATLVTVALGGLVSLTIEILQAFLPTRDSGTTDLITNSLGTYLGVLCYRDIYPALVARVPWLGWFAPPRA